MCGIVGIYLKTKKYEKHLGKFLSGMLDGMATRGPDSAGFAIYTKEIKKNWNNPKFGDKIYLVWTLVIFQNWWNKYLK